MQLTEWVCNASSDQKIETIVEIWSLLADAAEKIFTLNVGNENAIHVCATS